MINNVCCSEVDYGKYMRKYWYVLSVIFLSAAFYEWYLYSYFSNNDIDLKNTFSFIEHNFFIEHDFFSEFRKNSPPPLTRLLALS